MLSTITLGTPVRRILIACLAIFVVACESPTTPGGERSPTALEGERVVGFIVGLSRPDSEPRITVPGTVQAGHAFTVTVVTGGPNTCWRKDRTEAQVHGVHAIVIPFDIDMSEGNACLTAGLTFTHTGTLKFKRAGKATVIILARDFTRGGEHVAFERTIVVE